MSQWIIRPSRSDDEHAICAMHDHIFDFPMSPEHWRWLYQDNPSGSALTCVAEHSGTSIVGHYGAVPLPARFGDQDGLLLVGTDLMVHPDFRRQGIVTAMGLKILERAEAARDVLAVIAFMNKHSLPTHINDHLKWKLVSDALPHWVRPLNFAALFERLFGAKRLAQLVSPAAKLGYQIVNRPHRQGVDRVRVKQVDRFDQRANHLWQAAQDIAPVVVKRDAQYLNWRYACPTRQYIIFVAEDADGTLLGYITLSVRDLFGLKAAFIIDVLIHPAALEAADSLIHTTIFEAERQGCDLVDCVLFPHLPYVSALKRAGFMRAPQGLIPQNMHFGTKRTSTAITDEFLLEPRNWHITWSDHDAF